MISWPVDHSTGCEKSWPGIKESEPFFLQRPTVEGYMRIANFFRLPVIDREHPKRSPAQLWALTTLFVRATPLFHSLHLLSYLFS